MKVAIYSSKFGACQLLVLADADEVPVRQAPWYPAEVRAAEITVTVSDRHGVKKGSAALNRAVLPHSILPELWSAAANAESLALCRAAEDAAYRVVVVHAEYDANGRVILSGA